MENKKIFVVSNPDLGWDCVVGVFDAEKVTREELELQFPPYESYCIFHKDLESNTESYAF